MFRASKLYHSDSSSGPSANFPTHTDENIGQALLHQSNRVAAAQGTARRSSRNVHSFLSQDASLTLSLQLSSASLNSLSQGGTS